jgi:flagellar basal body rod protein FlgG
MFDALYIGATGMQAQQLNVDTIANNLANVNTTGFKRSRVSFTDLVARDGSRMGMQATDAGLFGPGASLGAGVGILNLSKLFDMGDLKKTDSPLDVTVRGDGFIEVAMPDGSTAYARGGTLKVTKDGQLATLSGLPLKANIAIPDDAQEILIHPEGLVQVRTSAKSSAMDVGRIDLVRLCRLLTKFSEWSMDCADESAHDSSQVRRRASSLGRGSALHELGRRACDLPAPPNRNAVGRTGAIFKHRTRRLGFCEQSSLAIASKGHGATFGPPALNPRKRGDRLGKA